MSAQAPAAPPPLPDLSPEELMADRGPGLKSFLIFLIVIMVIALSLRVWSRAVTETNTGRKVRRFWWDDWLALTALPLLLTAAALLLDMIRLGMGKHIHVVPPENLLPLLKRLFAIYLSYNLGLTLAKASCLLFYSRIFGSPSTASWFHRALYATHALNFGVWFGSVLIVAFNFNPTAQMAPGYKPSTKGMWLSSAVPGVTIDLILLVLPLPIIWKLRIKRSRKLAVLGVFVCGYCVVVVSLGRLVSIVQSNDLDADITYSTIPSIYWQAAEGPMTLLCVCLPSMLALWRKVMSVWKPEAPTTASSNGYYAAGTGKNGGSKDRSVLDTQQTSEMKTFADDNVDIEDSHSRHGSDQIMLASPAQIYVKRDVCISRGSP